MERNRCFAPGVSQVTRLIEGTEYEFRVAACNAAGTGPFSQPSDSAFAVDPLSESPTTVCTYHCYKMTGLFI